MYLFKVVCKSRASKGKKITEIGMIKGKWFYTPSGQKKRISAEGFTKNRQIIKPESGESA